MRAAVMPASSPSVDQGTIPANSEGLPMPDLIAACAYFLLIHYGVSGTRLRDRLTGRLGEKPYRGLFSLASLVGIAWMVYAYRRAPLIPTWGFLVGFRPTAYV